MRIKFLIIYIIIFGFIVVYMTQCDNARKNIQPLTKSWEKVVPFQEIPLGLASLDAEHCGACHPDHYEEWKYSTHAQAWTDLQFQAELKKESSPFLCINCHIPLQNQQEFIIEGLIDGDIYQPVKRKNRKFDKNLQQEGITCASCHVRNNVIIGPTGTDKAPHKSVKDTLHLSEQLCISCHNANAYVTPTLACTFETGDEWKAGPYYGVKNCIDCHMVPIIREITPGYGERLSHLHYFAGSGIPKLDTLKTHSLQGLGFYPSSTEESYSINDSIIYSLRVKNEFAGHKVPTGDPERFFSIKFELKNENGTILSTKNDRIGERWEWYPLAKKLSDNNLLPNEERTFTFVYKAEKKEKLTLSVLVNKNRMDKETADYNKLEDNYPLFITVFNETYDIEVK